MTSAANAAGAAAEARAPEVDVYEEKAFGFWLYLMSDAIIFALLFATYVVMAPNHAGGPTGKMLFNLSRTFAETMLLLCSSITFGFATRGGAARQPAGGAGLARRHLRARRRLRRAGDQRVHRHVRSRAPARSAAASCPPSSPWSAPTACMSAWA